MKVIVAVDDSPYAARVIDALLSRNWGTATEFRLLTVLEPICDCLGEDDCSPFSDTLAALTERRRRATKVMHKKLSKRISEALPSSKILSEIREGAPRKEIIDAALEAKADLILIGAHGTDVCPRNLMGSVSRAVASHAPCTVEVVRKSQSKEEAESKELARHR